MERRSFLGLMAVTPFAGMSRLRKVPPIITEWNDVTFEGGWSNTPELSRVQFKKDQCGFVRLKGTAFLEIDDSGLEPLPDIDSILFTLPVGFRPSETLMVPCPMSNQLINLPMYIGVDGDINIYFGSSPSQDVLVSFESISFEAA